MNVNFPPTSNADARQTQYPFSKTFASHFTVQNNVVNHENRIEIEQYNNSNPSISVNNYFVQLEEGQLGKVT